MLYLGSVARTLAGWNQALHMKSSQCVLPNLRIGGWNPIPGPATHSIAKVRLPSCEDSGGGELPSLHYQHDNKTDLFRQLYSHLTTAHKWAWLSRFFVKT